MGFSEELVKNRKAANLTQEDLAEKCNVSRQAIAKWEKGESLPDVYTIAKLAGLFEISIEELIWSQEDALLENKSYFVRVVEEKDRASFLKLMREHRYFGGLLQALDTYVDSKADDEIWNTYNVEAKSYGIFTKDRQDMIGYFNIESPESSAPQMTLQYKKGMSFEDDILDITRRFCNMISREYRIKAMVVHVNSELERQIFATFGYDNVKDEVILALPI